MPARLSWSGYGKAGVRLVRVERGPGAHRLSDLTVEVQLQGRFEPAHTAGNNSMVLPTDTMKNTVYALAKTGPVDPPEEFALALGRHFLEACPAAGRAVVSIGVHGWERLAVDGKPHPHAFSRGPEARRTVTAVVERRAESVTAGVEGLGLLKTTGSGFEGFLRDRYTTLAETADRIFATEVTASWRYVSAPSDWTRAWTATQDALVATFAARDSPSVQQTLYAMGEAALDACGEIAEIRLLMPNQHHLLVDLRPFGLTNPNEIYVATREPYGRIEAVVERIREGG